MLSSIRTRSTLLVLRLCPSPTLHKPIIRNKRSVSGIEGYKNPVLPMQTKKEQNPPVPKKILDLQQVNDILDTRIARLRGGIPRYDGLADVSLETLPENDRDHAPPTWEQFYDFIEKSVPSVGQNFQKTVNADQASWLFLKPAPLSDRPQHQFERTVENWRGGKFLPYRL
jgi:hypothetical protein